MAQGPKFPDTPLELLTNRGLIEEPYLNKFWGPALLGGFTFIGCCVANWYIRRPMLAGIQRHVVLTGIATVLGKYIDQTRSEYLAERDAVLRHYVELHPEDFPPFERKKYSEVFERWLPIR